MGLIGQMLLAILGILVTIVVAVLSRVLADDVKEWTPRVIEWLIGRALSQVHDDWKIRLREEWRANVATMPGTFAKLVYAVNLLRA